MKKPQYKKYEVTVSDPLVDIQLHYSQLQHLMYFINEHELYKEAKEEVCLMCDDMTIKLTKALKMAKYSQRVTISRQDMKTDVTRDRAADNKPQPTASASYQG